MKKKHNDLFKVLQADVDLKSDKCKKAINQLRTYKVQIDKNYPYADEKMYKNMIRKLLFLQQMIKNPELVKTLRCMQGEYHRKLNAQEAEQLADFHFACYGDGWCGVEYEY